ncbi:hypothetical protein KC571_00575 [candidate division WWE3 bacterium]|uniref:DUF7768 domain-containing protein n=1 Tax=candidate division WWE3 bacterium TaxID=2053526 RepID=A0A955RPR8_UNCKA|nr:hypothetical protein [candidate division WWE3 bacterium]
MSSLHETQKPIVFAAMSKQNFYLREHIIKFILEQNYTPTCAFMMFSYFLLDTVKRERLIEANNDLIRCADELWVFGDISDGVQKEINLANSLKLPIRYYSVEQFPYGIEEVNEETTTFTQVLHL